jgi:hypothetical protein
MTQITASSSETLKTTTAEGRLIEIFTYLQNSEIDKSKNPSLSDNVQSTFNANTLVFTGNFSLPTSQTIDSSGNITLSAVNYLTSSGFDPGSDGTFKSNNPAQYLIEVLTYLQNAESDATKNPQSKNFITGTFNLDEGTYSGNVTMPLAMTMTNTGGILFTAEEYLA